MTKQIQRNKVVVERLLAYCEDEGSAEVLADVLDVLLDDLRGEDFFGTEGQCDPRGDQRDDAEYSMWHVEGVDA